MTAARTVATIELVRSHSLTTLVQRELERQILSGELAPGVKLSEADVAEQLNVSRGPVREAFRALEECGLVRLEKNRGVFVRQIPIEEADEIYELRAVLDDFVGRRVTTIAGPDEIRELREHVTRMEKAAARKDIDGYLRANVEFHERLVAFAGNSKLLLMYRRLANELRLFRRATLARGDTVSISAREHRDILEYITNGKAAAAGRALYDHVMASRERMHRLYARSNNISTTRPPRSGTAKRAARITRREPEPEFADTPETGGRR